MESGPHFVCRAGFQSVPLMVCGDCWNLRSEIRFCLEKDTGGRRGCWGITAFESDEGPDAVEFIRENLPEDGKLELEALLEALKQDSWNAPPRR